MFSKKKKFHKEWIKKMDTMITGLILGWVVASIYGIAKKKKEHEEERLTGKKRKLIGKILKMLILGCPKEKEEKKPGILERLFTKK